MERYLRWKERYGTLIVVAVALILFFNLLFGVLLITRFPPAEHLYRNGLIVRIPSLHYAMIFAHGGYISGDRTDNATVTYHAMSYQGERYATLRFVQDLRREEYEYIWGSWCGSGDHEYIGRIEWQDGTIAEFPWPSYVSRNTRPGPTMPVYVGIGFVRLPVNGWTLDTLNSRSMEAS